MARLLAACGGFLLAVVWMDLMFDVQAMPLRAGAADEAAVASIAAYYRRVTTDAFPMNRLIGAVMLVAVAGSLSQVARPPGSRARAVAAALLAVGPTALAGVRVFPNAVRLGTRVDPLAVQAELAHAILVDHGLCVAAMCVFTALQLTAPRRER